MLRLSNVITNENVILLYLPFKHTFEQNGDTMYTEALQITKESKLAESQTMAL